jgi:tyrosine-protein kinase Etk/Wzc
MTSTSGREAPARSIHEAPDDELDLGRHLGILLKYRWSIAATIALTQGVGALYMAAATPIYRANAVLQIEKKGSSSGSLGNCSRTSPGKRPPSSRSSARGRCWGESSTNSGWT